jgi:hypothetical protein
MVRSPASKIRSEASSCRICVAAEYRCQRLNICITTAPDGSPIRGCAANARDNTYSALLMEGDRKTVKRKLRDLTSSDFPGVDPQDFETWKKTRLQAIKAQWLGLLVWGTALFTVPVIGGFIGWTLPMIFWFGYMFIYVFPLSNREKELAKYIGVNGAVLKSVLSK